MEEAGADCKYLGLPNMMQRSKVATLEFLRGKVKKRVLAWDGALISQGGKEILVKYVAQTLPTYAMSVFLLPEEIHRDIERTISKFWWNSRTGGRKGIYWMSWDRLSRHKSVGGMGFRNFKDFNLALLGKQGWRFLTNPSSLVSRVYKARYFTNVNFLEAKLGHNPSYIWRSILEAKELVASGARWKVGTGEDINILRQPWLSDSERPYIESDSIALENNKISSLMHVNQRSWDEKILSDLFTERDQECIKKIKIGEYGERDELYWSQERHGCYSVRSAYRLLQVQKSYWRMSDNNSFWNKIWRIKAPAKMLNLVWRSLSYCLPTLVMLQQKGVNVESRCPVCKRDAETIDHVFLHCSVAIQCWQAVIPNVQCTGVTFTQWWECVLANCDNNKKAEVAAVCWSLWKARNEVVWNNKFTRLYVIVANAKQYLEQWRYAQSKISYSLFPQTVEGDGGVSWVRPQELAIKVSVDAAIFREFNASGIGLIARDSKGEMIMAATVRLNEVLDPDLVEVMAIKEALSWTKNTTWQNIIVESDCLVAVQAIRSKVPMISPFGLIVEECRRMLQDQNTVSLSFIKRSANMVAHELARASYSFPDRYFDRSSVPIDVDVALKADLS